MRYSGGKAGIAGEIIPIVTKGLKNGMIYVEPFVGGCGTFSLVDHAEKVGIDNNPYVIEMWKRMQCGYMPPREVSREDYEFLKGIAVRMEMDENYSWLAGYVLNSCSYGSAWINGYAKLNEKRGENHVLEAYNNMMRQIHGFKHFQESTFINASYEACEEIVKDREGVIYCDPPYRGTKGYMSSSFDHDLFWDWVRMMSLEGHQVFVSEYSAPDDFRCVWKRVRKDGMSLKKDGEKQNSKIERVFVYDGC